MTDLLLDYYNRELEYFRQMGKEFADRYPKVAARLQLDLEGKTQDPHVERLIQAFALLNSRIRYKLDDDFPELAEALLNILYPHYLAPIPSMTVVQFVQDARQTNLTGGYDIPAGSLLETEPIGGEACTYRTSYPVTLWPIVVDSAGFHGRPFAAPTTKRTPEAETLLHLELSTVPKCGTFATLSPPALRFHLCLPRFQYSAALYEVLFSGALEVVLAKSATDSDPIALGPQSLKPVGFAENEGLLPYGPRSFRGYRLLTEYFSFPQKFLFFDLVCPDAKVWQRFRERVGVYIYLRPQNEDLGRLVSAETVRLGCTPIVNLFSQRCDPIRLTQREAEYRVVPDARRDSALEVHSIEQVTATSPEGKTAAYFPFYSARHAVDRLSNQQFWHASRRPRGSNGPASERDDATDVFLMLADLDFSPVFPADWTLHVDALCLNRDLPSRLAAARGGRIRYQLAAGAGPVTEIVALAPPTPTRRPEFKKPNLWRLVSHLSLNHLSLDIQSTNVDALKEILRLYDVVASDDTRDVVNGIDDVRCVRSVARVSGPGGGLCRGLDVSLTLDEAKFAGSGAYLFASVLSHFFGLYVSINSFARFKAVAKRQKDTKQAVWTWIPRAGEKPLL